MTVLSVFPKNSRLHQMKLEHDQADEQLQKYYLLTHFIEQQRLAFSDYTSRLQLAVNLRTISKHANSTANSVTVEGLQSLVGDANVYNLLIEGVSLLGSWAEKVLNQSAWKFAHPTNNYTNPDCPLQVSLYEMAVRYNYSYEERMTLVESIGMIKSLQRMLLEIDSEMLSSVHRHIYTTVQQFVRQTVREMLIHASKKKKTAAFA